MARPVYEATLLDAQTGQVLVGLNADVPTPPASFTKMMTLYLSKCFSGTCCSSENS